LSDIIVAEGLSKRYGKVLCVKDLDVRVPEGAVYGFLGPNGAGKSTTMKMILGLARPSGGTIAVFGKLVNSRNRLEILKNVGSLIESPSYYGHLTGVENLRILCTLKGLPEAEIGRVLKVVRLENQREKKVAQYSMGMKQRLGLASALLGSPHLLILDEPTNGLDPAGIQEMRELIRSLPEMYGMTVMISSHLLSEIDQMATNVGVISKGELVFQDSLAVLHEKSKSQIAVRTMDNGVARKVFTERGVPCETQEDYLLLPKLPDGELAGHVAQIFERGIGVLRIEERHRSLEDIFLDLTGTAVSL
jgi:ABC-2 type transport system ATP-binding protein